MKLHMEILGPTYKGTMESHEVFSPWRSDASPRRIRLHHRKKLL
jgi:hypothetical protein